MISLKPPENVLVDTLAFEANGKNRPKRLSNVYYALKCGPPIALVKVGLAIVGI
jgi:hypothetical protein